MGCQRRGNRRAKRLVACNPSSKNHSLPAILFCGPDGLGNKGVDQGVLKSSGYACAHGVNLSAFLCVANGMQNGGFEAAE